MADGPWTQYQAAPAESGPWDAYKPDTAASAAPAESQMSRLDRFGTGLKDQFVGAAQLVNKTLDLPQRAVEDALGLEHAGPDRDQYAAKREADIKATSPAGIDPYRVAGQVANPLNYTPLGIEADVAKAPITAAMQAGAKSALTEPVTDGGKDYWTKKTEQVAEGAAAGGALGAVGRGASKLVAPALGKAQKALADMGVPMTPGQLFGGEAQRIENIATKFPILGGFIRDAQSKGIEGFNTATINQALEPIGKTLPKGMQAGHDAIRYAQAALDDKYDEVLPKLTFKLTPKVMQDASQLTQLANELPPDLKATYKLIFDNRIKSRLGQGQSIDGQELKQLQSDLNGYIKTYANQGGAEGQLGEIFKQMKSVIRQNLPGQNPEYGKELNDTDAAYAMLTRVETAAQRRAASNGLFTPMDLLSAAKAGDQTARNRSFARGDALFQDWAESAQKVLPDKLPNSGTAERTGYFTGLGGLAAYMHNPLVAAGGAAAIAPYTGPGMAALKAYATKSPEARAAVGRALEYGAKTGAPLASILTQLGIRP